MARDERSNHPHGVAFASTRAMDEQKFSPASTVHNFGDVIAAACVHQRMCDVLFYNHWHIGHNVRQIIHYQPNTCAFFAHDVRFSYITVRA